MEPTYHMTNVSHPWILYTVRRSYHTHGTDTTRDKRITPTNLTHHTPHNERITPTDPIQHKIKVSHWWILHTTPSYNTSSDGSRISPREVPTSKGSIKILFGIILTQNWEGAYHAPDRSSIDNRRQTSVKDATFHAKRAVSAPDKNSASVNSALKVRDQPLWLFPSNNNGTETYNGVFHRELYST